MRLGYSSDLIPSARGSIVIRNWKPLPMEKVADGPLLTVGDILAELTSVATLKIQVYRSRPPPPSPAAEVRNKLLRLLLLHSHALLVSAGCPLDEVSCFRIIYKRHHGGAISLVDLNEASRGRSVWIRGKGREECKTA